MRLRVLIVLIILLGAAAGVARANRSENPPARSLFALFPAQLGAWHGIADPPLAPDVAAVLGADDYLLRTYTASPGAPTVGLYLAYWASQRQGDTIHSPLNCLPGAGWEPVSRETVHLADPRGSSMPAIEANRVVIENGLDRNLVLYWYQSHGRTVASEYWSRLYLIADAVRLNRTDGAIVRVITPIAGEGRAAEDAADQASRAFTTLVVPELHAFLPQ